MEVITTNNNNQTTSRFDKVEDTVFDPIVQILQRYTKCTDSDKINLTIGAYRDENLQPVVFRSVREAELRLLTTNKQPHTYLPPTGDEEFCRQIQLTIFPENHKIYQSKQMLTVQSISGTGSLRLGSEFISKYFDSKKLYIPEYTWPNHGPIAQASGLTPLKYRYYDPAKKDLDFDGMMEDLSNAEEGSCILLHVCGHNPLGVDPLKDKWKKIAELLKERNLFPFLDNAYQGFVSGDLEEDAYAIHMFYEMGFEIFIAHSFSKSMGLYGERAGGLHVISNDPEKLNDIKAKLGELALGLYIVPVSHGSMIVKTVLGDPILKQDWIDELKQIAGRLNFVRQKLHDALIEVGTPGNWDHVIKQKGMFCFTGLTEDQCEALISEHKIFLVKSGRISLAGLVEENVKKVALAIKEVVNKY